MDLNNRETGDPIAYVDTRVVDHDERHPIPRQDRDRHRHPAHDGRDLYDQHAADDGHRHPRPSRPATSTSPTRRSPDPGRPSSRSILFSRSTELRRDLERADRPEHRVAPGAERADCDQPGRRRGLRLVAAVRVHVAGRRRDDRAIDRWRRDVQQAGARRRDPSVRSGHHATRQFRTNGFQTMAIDQTGRVYLAWPDRGFATVAAGSGHRAIRGSSSPPRRTARRGRCRAPSSPAGWATR